MYNTKTQFYNIPRTIDVDSEDDYKQFMSQQGSDTKTDNNPDTL